MNHVSHQNALQCHWEKHARPLCGTRGESAVDDDFGTFVYAGTVRYGGLNKCFFCFFSNDG